MALGWKFMAKTETGGDWGGKAAKRKGTQPLFEYSPAVIEQLKRLEKAVDQSSIFDPDILENLKESLTPEPSQPERAVSEIAHFAVEAMRHASATNDRATRNIVMDLLEVLSRDEPCIVPAQVRRRSR
jgi:hypothetical protein